MALITMTSLPRCDLSGLTQRLWTSQERGGRRQASGRLVSIIYSHSFPRPKRLLRVPTLLNHFLHSSRSWRSSSFSSQSAFCLKAVSCARALFAARGSLHTRCSDVTRIPEQGAGLPSLIWARSGGENSVVRHRDSFGRYSVCRRKTPPPSCGR